MTDFSWGMVFGGVITLIGSCGTFLFMGWWDRRN